MTDKVENSVRKCRDGCHLSFKNQKLYMLIVHLKEGESIERAVKRYRKKYKKTRVLQNLRNNMYYTKPSRARKEKIERAIHKNQYLLEEEV